MDRRAFMGALAGVFAPLLAEAQPARKVPVVGVLATSTLPGGQSYEDLRKGLSSLGYVDGRTMVLQYRSAAGKVDALPRLAAELIGLKVDVLYAIGPPAVGVARDATTTMPIVAMDLETDPIEAGWVTSLSRPGGNITGLFLDLPSLTGKWLQLLREAAPAVRRVGLLWDSTSGSSQLAAAKAAAQRLGIDLQILEVHGPADFAEALRAGMKSGATAVAMLSSPIVSNASGQLADITMKGRLPAISPFRSFPDAGGLMSYGPSLPDFFRRGAVYVDKILKGAKPANLPIEQPTKFESVINLRTAKALGLTIPQSLLLRADEVIQ
jgi:putative ABC transport system substrate-binding protein